MRTIVWDMDGTIVDLYGKKDWLDGLRNETLDFSQLPFMTNCELIEDYIRYNQEQFDGTRFVVVTWAPMYCSDEYFEIVTRQKKIWVEENMPYVTEFYCLPYGVPKQLAPMKKSSEMILIDDNSEVLEMWESPKQRIGIQPTKDVSAYEIIMDIGNGEY